MIYEIFLIPIKNIRCVRKISTSSRSLNFVSISLYAVIKQEDTQHSLSLLTLKINIYIYFFTINHRSLHCSRPWASIHPASVASVDWPWSNPAAARWAPEHGRRECSAERGDRSRIRRFSWIRCKDIINFCSPLPLFAEVQIKYKSLITARRV